ncbi:MAG TPA: hypothetical protein VGB55_15870 [Tepidisphaeraceae bacterium]
MKPIQHLIIGAVILSASVTKADELSPAVVEAPAALTNFINRITPETASDSATLGPEVLAAALVGGYFLWRGRGRRWVI